MSRFFLFIAVVFNISFSSCGQTVMSDNGEKKVILNPLGETVEKRFNTPKGYSRVKAETNSFAYYLRTLPLKPAGAKVLTFDGGIKNNYNVYEAVVDLKIGKRDLHQCADAVMRLRAEYLYSQKRYDEIHFNFTNGFRVDYSEWIKGNRIIIEGNKTYWKKKTSPSTSYSSFWKYMEIIFSYAGTSSLSKELKSVEIQDMKIGDVFIKGGFPGHSVIVIDMAQNEETGKKLFILAQSYMPAQELQILVNRRDKNISPWYSVDFGDKLRTPEWTFHKTQLKRF